MRKVSRKPLFDVHPTEKKEPRNKRIKEKKESVEGKRTRRKKAEPVETPKEKDDWKDYNTSKPDIGIPVEFMIMTEKGKQLIFHGFRKSVSEAYIDEPYYFAILSKKFNNLQYRLINGCQDAWNCPDHFPSCDRCPKHKIPKRT